MKKNTRIINDIYDTTATTVGGKLCLTIKGHTTSKSRIEVKAEIDWAHWPYTARDIHTAWKAERASRIAVIERINAAFPADPTP